MSGEKSEKKQPEISNPKKETVVPKQLTDKKAPEEKCEKMKKRSLF